MLYAICCIPNIRTCEHANIFASKPSLKAPVLTQTFSPPTPPSFRDEEVVWDNVRVLKNGETVSTTGTHLGHNLPDGSGNRYCINLISVAGKPE